MALSNNLIHQFAKSVAKPSSNKTPTPTTLTGTVVISDGTSWVKIDGSDNLTPIETTTEIQNGDRVTVDISNHTATVTGNLTTPSASTNTTKKIGNQITEFENVVADRVTADYISATSGVFNELLAIIGQFKNLSAETIEAITVSVETLAAKYANIDNLTAESIEALKIETEELSATIASIENLSTNDLNAVNATINQLQAYNASFEYVNAEVIKAVTANINKLTTEKLDATWANIDYANIDQATIGDFFAKSGILQNITVSDVSITGDLVSVNITGSLIKGGTIAADRLMILGKDGLYHKLNASTEVIEEAIYVKTNPHPSDYVPTGNDMELTTTTGETVYGYMDSNDQYVYYCLSDGVYYAVEEQLTTVEAEATDYNSLNGKVIAANSITTDKIRVEDLVAFAATIGGFHIGTNSLFSGVKDEVNNTTRGIYLDNDGQICIGDSNNYLKFYEENGVYKLDIAASSVKFEDRDIDNLRELSTYIKMGSYTDPDTNDTDPCLELYEEESTDVQRQTNKRTAFIQDNEEKVSVGADGVNHYVNTEEHKGKYVWATRANGNFGLMWKDVIE